MACIANPTLAAAPASPSGAARPAAARTRMLLEAPVIPTLLRLAVPNVLNLLALVGLITFDGLFVGRLGADALAGISLVFPWIMLMQHGGASGVGGAVSSAVARALGAGDQARADAIATHAFALALLLSLLFAVTMGAAGPLVYQWMGGRGPVLEAAVSYSRVAFAGIVSVWMLNLLGNVVRGTGNMVWPSSVIMLSVLGHVSLSPLLIFGAGGFGGLGVSGAAWGLVASFGIGSMALFLYLRSGRSLVRLRLRGVPLRRELFSELFRVGIPGLANVAITNLTVVVLTGIAVRLGRDAAIGYAMGARLEYIMNPIAFGIGTGIVAMVGTSVGAGRGTRAREAAWKGAAVIAGACGCVGVFFALFPGLWMAIFTGAEPIVRAGSDYLRVAGPAYALYGLGMASYFACQGYGKVMRAVAANAARLLVASAAGLLVVSLWQAGIAGFSMAVVAGFIAHAALGCAALLRVAR